MDPYFLVFAIMALGAGVFMISVRDAFPSALGLLTVFIALAALYLHLHAPLVAIFQVSIYAGSILVLIVFVIMLLMTPGQRLQEFQRNLSYRIMGGILGVCLIALLVIGLRGAGQIFQPHELGRDFGVPKALGELFFNRFLIHFEVVSVLLLVAMVGAIYLAKRRS